MNKRNRTTDNIFLYADQFFYLQSNEHKKTVNMKMNESIDKIQRFL